MLLETARELWSSLTPRERQVALLIGDGMSQREMAEKLGVTVSAVKAYTGAIYRKLNIHSRAQLAIVLIALDENHYRV